ncbi:hypothetical protein G7Y89_g13442 [Cudoniella acicularis]|uniref:Zn(2)-C6 fungal-type domain-containing protein n=1 Tax=Cudoniella acicularis TaxID=354080 RepID=A0A8H4RAP3_9HELO|nr:hypothetical protein G7Y89_g13442 [Cudoniella acicularis]
MKTLSGYLDDAYRAWLGSAVNCCSSGTKQAPRRDTERPMRIEHHQPRLVPPPFAFPEPQEKPKTRGREWVAKTKDYAARASSRGSFSVRRRLNAYNGPRRSRPQIGAPSDFRHVEYALPRQAGGFRPLELSIYTEQQHLSPILLPFGPIEKPSNGRDSKELPYPPSVHTHTRSESQQSFRIPRKPVRSSSDASSEWMANFRPRPESLSAQELLEKLESELPRAPPPARLRSMTEPPTYERIKSALHEKFELERQLKDIDEVIEERRSIYMNSRPTSRATSRARSIYSQSQEPMPSPAVIKPSFAERISATFLHPVRCHHEELRPASIESIPPAFPGTARIGTDGILLRLPLWSSLALLLEVRRRWFAIVEKPTALNMTQIYTRPFIGSLHERSVNYERQPAQYIQRDLQKTDTLSTVPDREPERTALSQPKPRSPMFDDNKGNRGPGDMYQSRPETTQKPPRESLPSLSSLFGSSTHPSRPAQSPYSERQSPVFPATSPHDARPPVTPMDRPFDGSYFQRPARPAPAPATTQSQQYPFSSRPEQVERLGVPPPPRPLQSTKRPESPRYEGRFGLIDTSRTQVPPPVNAWSPHSQSGRPEYFSRDTSSSFRTHSDHPPPPMHRPEHEVRGYRDGSHSIPPTPSFPPTPASTVIGEATTGKDGLGPKIWTGTQFLPRFVRQAEVAGEGMCYFYDDGTHCKTVIDGEVVNAHWGVTKAGKPRKRLAIACITCREKKIKCDPDYPRCVQCEKFGRVCKFKNAPRGGQGSPDTPPADPEDVMSRPASSRADGESFKTGHRENSASVSPRQVLRQASTESDNHPSKRQRTGYNDFTPVPSEGSPQPSPREAASPTTTWAKPTLTGPVNHELYREWQVNPYSTRPSAVSEIVDIFFKQCPETASSMFPQNAMKAWIFSGAEKSLDDLMLIYSILTIGSVFSPRQEHKALGSQYALISRFACENRRFSLQLVQSRLLLSLYYFAINNANDAWDFCGSAVRAASGLRLNVELEKGEDSYLRSFPYGLNRHGYAECRRRTFWSCYLVDRFNGFCSGHFSMLQPEDVFLRLPCDTASFESQVDVQNPFFDVATPPIQNINWTVGSIAYLINISTIWGDVMANIYRSSQRRSASVNSTAFSTFYEGATRKLRLWNDTLPDCYSFSADNLQRAADNGKLSTFMTMHTVYHTTTMKLNRYIQLSSLSSAQVLHHVSVAHQHAEALLSIADTLAARRTSSPPSHQGTTPAKLSSPFVGYAIVSAIDILTSKVSLSSVPSRLASFSGAQSVLAELAIFWQSSKNQQALVLERVRDLAELTTGKHEQSGASSIGFRFGTLAASKKDGREGIFEMREAIEKTFSRDYDCVYA